MPTCLPPPCPHHTAAAYEKGGQLGRALDAFREQLAAGVAPDLITYSSLITACERAGARSVRRQALSAVGRLHQPQPARCRLASTAACGWQHPAYLLAWLPVRSSCPASTAPLPLPAAAAGEVERAASLLDQLHEGGLVGNHALYHGVMGACQAAGRWELALEVFLGMQVGGWVGGRVGGCWWRGWRG